MKRQLIKAFFLAVVLSFVAMACKNSAPFDNNINDDNISIYKDRVFVKEMFECMNMPRPNGSHIYTLYHPLEKYNTLGSIEKKKQVSEIAPKKLRAMSTQAVIQAIWEHPLFLEFYGPATSGAAVKTEHTEMFEDTNAYRELVRRKDAGQCLLDRWELLRPAPSGIMILYTRSFEILLSQPNLIAQLSTKECKKVVELSFEKEKQINESIYENYFSGPELLLIARTMQHAEYHPFIQKLKTDKVLKEFIQSPEFNVYGENSAYISSQITAFGKKFIQ